MLYSVSYWQEEGMRAFTREAGKPIVSAKKISLLCLE